MSSQILITSEDKNLSCVETQPETLYLNIQFVPRSKYTPVLQNPNQIMDEKTFCFEIHTRHKNTPCGQKGGNLYILILMLSALGRFEVVTSG
jgi:hypothetical protein